MIEHYKVLKLNVLFEIVTLFIFTQLPHHNWDPDVRVREGERPVGSPVAVGRQAAQLRGRGRWPGVRWPALRRDRSDEDGDESAGQRNRAVR